jgi:hypothetical protein
MPYLSCNGCGSSMQVNVGSRDHWNEPQRNSQAHKLIGSATCRGCGTGTGFEIIDNVIVYVSGRSSYGELNTGIDNDTKMLFAEAELCFQNGVPNAAAAMCRASVELALIRTGFNGNNLYELIKDAEGKGKLDTVEVGLAHSTRLMTRGAIHRGEFISLADVPSMLSATVTILNKLF